MKVYDRQGGPHATLAGALNAVEKETGIMFALVCAGPWQASPARDVDVFEEFRATIETPIVHAVIQVHLTSGTIVALRLIPQELLRRFLAFLGSMAVGKVVPGVFVRPFVSKPGTVVLDENVDDEWRAIAEVSYFITYFCAERRPPSSRDSLTGLIN